MAIDMSANIFLLSGPKMLGSGTFNAVRAARLHLKYILAVYGEETFEIIVHSASHSIRTCCHI